VADALLSRARRSACAAGCLMHGPLLALLAAGALAARPVMAVAVLRMARGVRMEGPATGLAEEARKRGGASPMEPPHFERNRAFWGAPTPPSYVVR